jgi:hypothetical protein
MNLVECVAHTTTAGLVSARPSGGSCNRRAGSYVHWWLSPLFFVSTEGRGLANTRHVTGVNLANAAPPGYNEGKKIFLLRSPLGQGTDPRSMHFNGTQLNTKLSCLERLIVGALFCLQLTWDSARKMLRLRCKSSNLLTRNYTFTADAEPGKSLATRISAGQVNKYQCVQRAPKLGALFLCLIEGEHHGCERVPTGPSNP